MNKNLFTGGPQSRPPSAAEEARAVGLRKVQACLALSDRFSDRHMEAATDAELDRYEELSCRAIRCLYRLLAAGAARRDDVDEGYLAMLDDHEQARRLGDLGSWWEAPAIEAAAARMGLDGGLS